MAQAVAWHRQVAAMGEAADRAGVATDDLSALRERLSAQAGLLTQSATRLGGPLPALVPTPAEIAIAGQSLGDLSAAAIAGAVRTMNSTLAAVDSALGGAAATESTSSPTITSAPPASEPPGAPAPRLAADPPVVATLARRPVRLRNAAIYGAYSAVVFVVQAMLYLMLDEARLPAAAPVCLLVLPALAWLAGYLTVGTLFPAPPGEQPNRTPKLGAVVCLLPDGLLCGGAIVLFTMNFLC